MLQLSKKTRLALEAVVDVAYNARPDPVQSRDITKRQGIPQRYLEQVMQHLVHAGILKGVRGPRGGYRLARERRRITMGEVVRVVSTLEAAEENGNDEVSPLGDQVVRPIMERMHDKLMEELDTITIEDLCRDAQTKGIAVTNARDMDFDI